MLATVAAAAVVVPVGVLWWSSLLPDEYSVVDMGYVDWGGAPPSGAGAVEAQSGHGGHGGHGALTDIAGLGVDPDRPADVRVTLEAREQTVRLGSGREVQGYTLDGRSPGPTIRAREGDLVEVRLTNVDVAAGATLHWHGVDVPNSMDGVAGVTQDAVLPGERFTYRFVAEQVGTYWYHSHQVSHEQVRRGLLGALVVVPRAGLPEDGDVTALLHSYDGVPTLNGQEGDVAVPAEPGEKVRVRVINTDNDGVPVWVTGASYRVLAVDGYDLHRPAEVSDRTVTLTAGGRVDLEVVVPAAGVRVDTAGVGLVLGATRAPDPVPQQRLDLLSYGEPAALPFDPASATRHFDYRIGRRPGFLDGRPGLWWTVNGHLYPDIPMYMVEEGDLAVMRIENDTGHAHPMHLHGHHAVVLSRDGVRATGSPWWVDSLHVAPGETYEIAFRADNPGVWMDHCHNLPHAVEGMIAHLMYADVTTPFTIGGTHAVDNRPE